MFSLFRAKLVSKQNVTLNQTNGLLQLSHPHLVIKTGTVTHNMNK